jgi:hypothetical protein
MLKTLFVSLHKDIELLTAQCLCGLQSVLSTLLVNKFTDRHILMYKVLKIVPQNLLIHQRAQPIHIVVWTNCALRAANSAPSEMPTINFQVTSSSSAESWTKFRSERDPLIDRKTASLMQEISGRKSCLPVLPI